MDIKEKYMFDFTPEEKKTFQEEQQLFKSQLACYREYVRQSIKEHLPISINNNPKPFTLLEVKYLINRLLLDDSELTSLHFNQGDKVNGDTDARKIAKALRNNTHCQEFEFDDCGFTDTGVEAILDELDSRKVLRLTLRKNPLTIRTYQRIQELTTDPKNQWKIVELGDIWIGKELHQQMAQNPKITHTVKTHPFAVLSKILNRQRN